MKRKAYVISFDTPVYGDERLTLMDIIAVDNTDSSSLLEEISERLPTNQFNIVRMKSEGYNDREIAKMNDLPVKSVQETLLSVRDMLYPSLV
jgi:DNA-directed RNA polymerase specialized sigma24 family protein